MESWLSQGECDGEEERKIAKREIRERVGAVLESVQMGDYAERKINQLSGGQQQRVALARALVIRPHALLLDEPLSNLDAQLRLEMRSEIRRVCREFGLTAVYVTHDQKEALSISDRMAILESGKIAQVGTPHEVYRRPASKLVAHFIGETNFINGRAVEHRDGNCLVETAYGKFSGTAAYGYRPTAGEPVILSIRPEALNITSSLNAENCIAGIIENQTYLGEIAQYRVAAADNQLLKMFELNPRVDRRQQADKVILTADSSDVVILPG